MSVNKEFNLGKMTGTIVHGKCVELYIPRKCQATSKLIGPSDHVSIQLTVPAVDEHGKVLQGADTIIPISGFIRTKGRSEWEIEKILRAQGLYPLPEDL